MRHLILLTLLSLSSGAFAYDPSTQPLKLLACNSYAAIDLAEDHAEWTETFHMINSLGEVVGVYSYKDDQIHAAICDYSFSEELTVASEWYYWDAETNANPAAFGMNDVYWISQDEGQANFKVLETSAAGEIKVVFTVTGLDENGNDHDVRVDSLTFKKIH